MNAAALFVQPLGNCNSPLILGRHTKCLPVIPKKKTTALIALPVTGCVAGFPEPVKSANREARLA
jgi:hypothetical protein